MHLKGECIMNQIKIGEFIAALRKEQNLTQLELANKLGVTDRAVSKWENGRGLPDISLIVPLCEALSISVNELLCGERIITEDITAKSEENIIETLNYSEKRIKKTKLIFYLVLASVLSVIVIFATAFAIDIGRMINNKPVVFSTWGIDYAPPVDLKNEEIELAIKDYLVEHGDNEEKHQEGVKTFVAFKTYLIEETASQYNVYAWVLEEMCYMDKNDIMNYGSFSMPFLFTLEKREDTNKFVVVDSRYPRDGSYYDEDMKSLFPSSVRKEMDKIHKDGTFERLQLQINEQVNLYFHK